MAYENLYHRDYYLKDCQGFEEFLRTRGKKLPRRLAKCLTLADVKPFEKVIDVGAGRGELSLHAALRGATVVAIDPSRDALKLLGEARAAWEPAPESTLQILGRGDALPIRAEWADVILLSDVVEHLFPEDLSKLIGECARALKPGGRLVIHTQPNRTLVELTVPFLARFSRLWGVALPRDLRSEMTPGSGKEYHPGEQSRRSLKKALLDTRLRLDELWLEGSYAVHRIFGEARFKGFLLHLFRRSRLLKELFATQIFALARKA